MSTFQGKSQGSSMNLQELNRLKQICEKYDSDDDSIIYSTEFNTILEKAATTDLAQTPGLTEDLAYINKILGDMCYYEKNYEQSLAHYDAAVYYYSKLNQKADLAAAIQGVSDASFMLDQFAKVLEYNPIVLEYYKEVKEEAKAADSNYYMAESYYQLNDYENAAQYSHQALAYYEKVRDISNMAYCFVQLAKIHFYNDNYTEAIRFYKKAANAHQQLGQLEELVTDYLDLGHSYYFDDQNENAKSTYLEALAVLRKNYDLDNLRIAYIRLIRTCYQMDEYQEVIEFGTKALKLYGEAEPQHDLIEIYSVLGDIYYFQENYSKAITAYSEAEWRCSIYFEDDDDLRKKGQLNKDMFQCCYDMNDFDNAIQFLQQAIEINEENDFQTELADNFLDLARTLFRGKKEAKEAYEYCLKALEILDEEDEPVLKGKIHELTGDIHLDIKFHSGKGHLSPDIFRDAISSYSKAFTCFQEAGETDMQDMALKKINIVKAEM